MGTIVGASKVAVKKTFPSPFFHRIGGELKDIEMLPGRGGFKPHLGSINGSVPKNPWFNHRVVLKDGRVYDRLTGGSGKTIAEYKAMFENSPLINWPF